MKVKDAQSVTGPANGLHPVAKTETLWRELEKVNARFGEAERVFGVIKNGNTVTHVLAAAEDGYHAYPCTVSVDATGDGDLAAAAGANYSMGRDSDGFPLFYGYLPIQAAKGKMSYYVKFTNNGLGYVDPTDTLDYSIAHFSGRASLWREGPFTAEKHYCALASLLGIRQGRSIHGPVVLTAEDFAQGRTWPDKVCAMSSNYDRAGFFALENDWIQRWVVMFGLFPFVRTGEIPYRALYPEGVEGMLLACRAFSVEHDLASLTRMRHDMQQLGEVSGLAAALAVQSGRSPSCIDVAALQGELRERGVLPEEAPEKILDVPTDELLKKLGGEQNGLAMWRLSQKNGDPDWERFANEEGDQRKHFCAGVAAAMRGDTPNVLMKVLEKAVDDRIDSPRLGDRSSALCVVAALALAHAKGTAASARIAALLADVPRTPYLRQPEITLIYRALGIAGGRDAVKAIQGHLASMDAPKTSDDMQVVFAGVKELQGLGCFDESHRLEPHRQSEFFLFRKAALRLDAARKKQ